LQLRISERTLRGLSRGTDKGSCFLHLGKEDAERTLLECPETKIWQTEFLGKKLLNLNSELVYIKR
jgi:hypothetical protein